MGRDAQSDEIGRCLNEVHSGSRFCTQHLDQMIYASAAERVAEVILQPHRCGPECLCQRLRKIAEVRARKEKVTIRPIKTKKIDDEGQRIRTVYNQAWEKNWGFVPFTEVEAEHMARELKPLIVPPATLIAEIGERPIGFVIGVPDINVALRKINGRLMRFGLPIGLIKLLYYLKKTKTGRLIALGVVQEYRRSGIAEMLVLRLMDEAFRRGFTGELSMTLEDNVMVNRFIEAMGAARYKTYRIYRRQLS